MIITIDGPAGSGKSTTARTVAARLGFRHLDSGALYRALTFALLDAGVPEGEWRNLAVEDLERFDIAVEPAGDGFRILLGGRPLGPELRSPEVGERVSPLAAHPAVREWLLERQREAGRQGRLVADGRDMGATVFPAADLKVFLTADLRERARRRLLERGGGEPEAEALERSMRELADRDRRDAGREASPLRRAPDAVVLDTTGLSFEEQVEAIVDLARAFGGGAGEGDAADRRGGPEAPRGG